MIIISRNRDYYDYLVGMYGRDEKKVLNRRNDIKSSDIPYSETTRYMNYNTYNIYVASRRYIVEQTSEGVWEFHKFHKVNTNYRGYAEHRRAYMVDGNEDYIYYKESTHNELTGQPLSIEGAYHKAWGLSEESPILSSFGFSTILSPEEVYSEVDSYLGYLLSKKEVRAEQDDKSKLLSKGFDSKASFRHRK